MNEVDDSADAESLRSLVYVASTEVAGHRRRWVTLAGVGAAATVAIFVGGVLSTGEPEKLPADVVSADEKNEVVEDPPAEAETDTADEAEAPPLTIVLDPDAFRQQRESAE